MTIEKIVNTSPTIPPTLIPIMVPKSKNVSTFLQNIGDLNSTSITKILNIIYFTANDNFLLIIFYGPCVVRHCIIKKGSRCIYGIQIIALHYWRCTLLFCYLVDKLFTNKKLSETFNINYCTPIYAHVPVQFISWHFLSCVVSLGQGLPPCNGWACTFLVAFWEPVPQVTLHWLQASHWLIVQPTA